MQNLYVYTCQRAFFGLFLHIHAMLYAKMFHGYDILKHEKAKNLKAKKGCTAL